MSLPETLLRSWLCNNIQQQNDQLFVLQCMYTFKETALAYVELSAIAQGNGLVGCCLLHLCITLHPPALY